MSLRPRLPESSLTALQSKQMRRNPWCLCLWSSPDRKWPHVFPTVWTGRKLSSSCPRHVPAHSRPQEKAVLPRQRQLNTHVQRSEVTPDQRTGLVRKDQEAATGTSPSDWRSQSRSRSWMNRSPRAWSSPVQPQHRRHTLLCGTAASSLDHSARTSTCSTLALWLVHEPHCWTRCTLTCVPELTLAHVLGEHGREALQLGDDSQVKFDVISPAADAPAEVHLHCARASSDLQRICASFPRAWARVSAVTYRRAEVAPLFLFLQFQKLYWTCMFYKQMARFGLSGTGCPRSGQKWSFCLTLWYIYLTILDLFLFRSSIIYLWDSEVATNKPS